MFLVILTTTTKNNKTDDEQLNRTDNGKKDCFLVVVLRGVEFMTRQRRKRAAVSDKNIVPTSKNFSFWTLLTLQLRADTCGQ